MAESEVKMTPEILKKLRGISVVSKTVEFVYEIDDVPEEFHPKFTIKGFTVEDSKRVNELRKKASEVTESEEGTEPGDEEPSMSHNEILEEIVRSHIMGWSRLYDLSTGKPFRYKKSAEGEGVDQDTYLMLPIRIRSSILRFLYSLIGLA